MRSRDSVKLIWTFFFSKIFIMMSWVRPGFSLSAWQMKGEIGQTWWRRQISRQVEECREQGRNFIECHMYAVSISEVCGKAPLLNNSAWSYSSQEAAGARETPISETSEQKTRACHRKNSCKVITSPFGLDKAASPSLIFHLCSQWTPLLISSGAEVIYRRCAFNIPVQSQHR